MKINGIDKLEREEIRKKIFKEGNFDFFIYRGFPCFIIRPAAMRGNFNDNVHFIHLCGYVGVPKGHKLYKKHYASSDFPDFNVHGGVTYTGFLFSTKDYWFIGFDCAHLEDMAHLSSPSFYPYCLRGNDWGDTYRDMEYVRKELKKLVRQIEKVK